MASALKKVGLAVGGLVVVVIAAVLILPRLVPVDTVRTELIEQTRLHTGRTLSINGPMSVSLFPSLHVEVHDVGLSNPPGARVPQMAKVGRLDLALKVLPLLSHRIELDSFVLVDPVLDLEVDPQGRPNWVMNPAAPAQPPAAAPAAPNAPPAAAGPAQLPDVHLGDVRLVNGTVTYADRPAGRSTSITAINLALSLPSLNDPVAATGDLTWSGQRVVLDLHAGAPSDLVAGKPTPVKLSVKSDAISIGFDGHTVAGGADGQFSLALPSVAKAAALAAIPNPVATLPGGDIGPITLAGKGGMDSPLEASGSVTLAGEALSLKLATAALREIAAGKPVKASFSIDGKPLKLTFDGTVGQAKGARIDGPVTLALPSVPDAAKWLGLAVPADVHLPAKVELSATLAVDDRKIALSGLKLAVDAVQASGGLAVDAAATRPAITANLDFGRVDLNPWLAPAGAAPSPGAPAPAPAPAPAAAAGDWSDTPIDASALNRLDADVSLTAAAVVARKIETGKLAVTARLHGGHLAAELKDLAAFGGKNSGTLTVDPSGNALAVDLRAAVQGIQARPMLTALADFQRLEGTGAMDLTVAGRGRSQRDLVKSLNGKGAVKFTNGAIVGINVAAMMRNVGSAFTDSGGEEKTDFSELSDSFTIANGILRSDDLKMEAPLLRLTGKGTVDLPARTLSWRLEPKVVATLQGQGGAAEQTGITVPVVVEGPWAKLKYKPDLAAALQNGALDAAQKALQNGAKPADLLKGLLGGGKAAPAAPAAPAQPTDPNAPPPAKPPKPDLGAILKQLGK